MLGDLMHYTLFAVSQNLISVITYIQGAASKAGCSKALHIVCSLSKPDLCYCVYTGGLPQRLGDLMHCTLFAVSQNLISVITYIQGAASNV